MRRRNLYNSIAEAMTDTPVVLVHGPRQSGKSTLVRAFAGPDEANHFLTLDDPNLLAAALDDPAGFLARHEGPLVLDEVQRAPDLFLAMKLEVDENRQPGRFLLTGSADILLIPNLSESLAGRMEILTLWPFSSNELAGNSTSIIDTLFAEGLITSAPVSLSRSAILDSILTGGFPEAVARTSTRRRDAWFASYINTILQRDVRELANVEHLMLLPRLLSLLAVRAMSLLNYSELSRALGLPYTTLQRYIALLEMTFMVRQIPPWSANLGKRLVKSPKMMFCDTGLMAHSLGVDSSSTIPDHFTGALVENYVAMELTKHLGWSETRARLYHFRERTGKEVDLILENARGQIVGIEVKSSATVSKNDFKHLRFLRDALGDRFVRGVVFYTGKECITFGERLEAVSLSVLSGTSNGAVS